MSSEIKITVLISGFGSNLQAIMDACNTPALPSARIIRVICNREKAFGRERARNATPPIPDTYHPLPPYSKKHPSSDPSVKHSPAARKAFDADLAALVLTDEPDLVILAGWMLIFSDTFLDPLKDANVPVINLHPALPGAFDGADAIGRAFAAFQKGQVTKTGIMCHYVIAEVDRGEPIVVQEVDMRHGESRDELEQRMHKVEHRVIIEGARLVSAAIRSRRGLAKVQASS